MLKKIKHELNYLKVDDIFTTITFLAALLPAFIVRIYLRLTHKSFWLISEDKNEARDNGICFFKYLNENHKDQVSYYAISSSSPDYEKVKAVGNVVEYGTIKHWILYLNSEYNISTQKSGKPGAAVGYVLEQSGLIKDKFIFLQHGITLSKAYWLFYKNTKMRLFICGAEPEFEYVKKEFGYPDRNVAYLGFCRFDDYHKAIETKRQILLIPSWREWIGSRNEFSDIYEDTSIFENTEYYKKYQSLINNEQLHAMLLDNNLDLVFYPHRNMQKYIKSFSTSCERIKIVGSKEGDIRKLLMESALMITDYSSVALDFAYMKKNVIFYQFDVERFRQAQYERGYFDYENSGLGLWTDNELELISLIAEVVNMDFSTNDRFIEAHKAFFDLYDDRNCERTYLKLKEISHDKNSNNGI